MGQYDYTMIPTFSKPLEYRPGDNYELANVPRRDRPQHDVYDGLRNRQTTHMTGYTGYVPGMNFRYLTTLEL